VNGTNAPIELRDPIPDARAIRDCLNYLHREATQANLNVAAYLIGAAALCIEEDLKKHQPQSGISILRLHAPEH
jgi:hypothetical protein